MKAKKMQHPAWPSNQHSYTYAMDDDYLTTDTVTNYQSK